MFPLLAGLAPSLLGSTALSSMAPMALNLLSGDSDGLKGMISTLGQGYLASLGVPPQISGPILDGLLEAFGPGVEGGASKSEMAEMLSEETGMPLSEATELLEELEQAIENLVDGIMETDRRKDGKTDGKGRAEGKGEGEGEEGSEDDYDWGDSWIMVLASAMGEMVDDKNAELMAELKDLEKLEKRASAEDEWVQTGSSKTKTWGVVSSRSETHQLKQSQDAKEASNAKPSKTIRVQGLNQEFTMLMNAASNIVKTAGQAASTAVTKQ